MKCAYVLLFVCCLLPVGLAKPAPPILNYQDTYGQYSFGYSGPTSARSEFRTLDGVTHGTYSYIDDAGVIQSARYIADDQGFRITATNIPQGPVYLQTSPGIVLAQLKTRNVDQVVDPGETNVFLKQVRQEADLTPGDKQQVAAASNTASTGSALVSPQTRIGEDNVFLQQAKGLSGEKQLGAAIVPDIAAPESIAVDSRPETKIGENNVFLQQAKGLLGEKQLGAAVVPDVAAPGSIAVDSRPETKIGENNVFLQQARGLLGEKQLGAAVVPDVAATGSIAVDSIPKTKIGENNVFLTQVREEQQSVFSGKVAAEGRIGNVEENAKSDTTEINKVEHSQGNSNVAVKKTQGESVQKDVTLTQSSPASTSLLRLGPEDMKVLNRQLEKVKEEDKTIPSIYVPYHPAPHILIAHDSLTTDEYVL